MLIITSLGHIEERGEMFHLQKYWNCSESSIQIAHDFCFCCWHIYQQTLHSLHHIHNSFFQQLMQNVNHHALMYVDQVMISCEIFHQMQSIIISWMNFILLLKLKLSNDASMSLGFQILAVRFWCWTGETVHITHCWLHLISVITVCSS